MTEAAVTAICAEINEALAACVAANVNNNRQLRPISYGLYDIAYII